MSVDIKYSSSKEIDIEISDYNSENILNTEHTKSTRKSNYLPSSSVYLTKSSSDKDSSTEEIIMNSDTYSYYDENFDNENENDNENDNSIMDKTLTFRETNDNPSNVKRVNSYTTIDFTGDKADETESTSDNSTKSNIESLLPFDHALRLNRLRNQIIDNDFTTKSNNKTKLHPKQSNMPKSTEIKSSEKTKQSNKKSSNRNLNLKKYGGSKSGSADTDSITLLIKVPRSKLLNHFAKKDSSFEIGSNEYKSRISSSCDSLDSSETVSAEHDKPSHKKYVQSENRNLKLNSSIESTNKTNTTSSSDVSSLLDKSKHILKSYKKVLMKNRNSEDSLSKNQETQTNAPSIHSIENDNSKLTNDNKTYFLCNICRKIVPSNLSPICQKLTCTALDHCSQQFHSELDMIMHLPVKHEQEFATYEICSECNRMYHPSHIFHTNGYLICVDCCSSQ